MNATEPQSAWQGPRWALAILLAILGTLGPFSIDTYIPAFDAIAQATAASPTQMQQTLSAYLFGFAFMNLFHGALSDSLGRRPVVLGGLVVFTLAPCRAFPLARASWSRAPSCATSSALPKRSAS